MSEIEAEQEKTRAEIASYLREFADELDTTDEVIGAGGDSDRQVTVIAGNESATLNPPETLRFGVNIDTESSLLETGADRGATFTLRWDEDEVDSPDEFDVE